MRERMRQWGKRERPGKIYMQMNCVICVNGEREKKKNSTWTEQRKMILSIRLHRCNGKHTRHTQSEKEKCEWKSGNSCESRRCDCELLICHVRFNKLTITPSLGRWIEVSILHMGFLSVARRSANAFGMCETRTGSERPEVWDTQTIFGCNLMAFRAAADFDTDSMGESVGARGVWRSDEVSMSPSVNDSSASGPSACARRSNWLTANVQCKLRMHRRLASVLFCGFRFNP